VKKRIGIQNKIIRGALSCIERKARRFEVTHA